ncbi:MAG: PBP1A family penicillin-binding protein [Gemmatimonadota bacterium]|nr:PBP1A family penicillin-binding protein [Gemmatimonadota bacterium]
MSTPPPLSRGALLLAAFLAAVSVLSAQDSVSVEPWQLVQPPQSSLVFARDGTFLGEIGRQWRTSVSLQSLPRYVPDAFVAVEDHRFYSHEGVDVIGIAGALRDRLLGSQRGASTITQQLVGNMHPDQINRADKSVGRKLREQAAALEMERHYGKETILEAYLNQLDFGHGWFGIDAAARHYFGKPASKLSLAEAASLAALPRSPPIYDPIAHPGRNRQRRDLVLGLMAQQGLVTRDAAEQETRTRVVTVPNGGMVAGTRWVLDLVRRQAAREGVPVVNGGYQVQTTIDPALQREAVAALARGAARVESRPGWRYPTLAKHVKGRADYLQGMVVAVESATGDVVALVGGRDYGESQFNRVVNGRRQPGSAIKPLVYATAIADGIPPNAIIPDTALEIPLDGHRVYRPRNSDRVFLGAITMREALAQSRNSVAVQLGQRVSIDSVAALSRRLGITAPMAPVPSSAIGASALAPIELVSAYTALANLGVRSAPRLIQRIDDRAGHPVYAGTPVVRDSVLDPRVAFIVRDMLRGVIDHGTAASIRPLLPDSVPVAGKTGTTDDATDVWFIGMTPELVAGVWLGFDTPRPIPGGAGGSYAAPIWAEMMSHWYRDRSPGSWSDVPEGIVTADLDRATGEPVTELTPPERRYTEYFLRGTEPGAFHLEPWKLLLFLP